MTDKQVVRRAAGVLDVTTNEGWDLVARKAKALSKSSVIPQEYQNKPANVLVAMEMAQRTDIPVLAVMQNLHIINGRPSWSSQFLISAVNRSGRFSPIRFQFEGEEGKDSWGCRAVATDLDSGEVLTGTLITITMAKAEGWSTKSGSKWKTMPEQMLRYRAAAFWARVHSPELAVGLHTSEEVADMPVPTEVHVAKVVDALDADDDDGKNFEVVDDAEDEPDPLVEDKDANGNDGGQEEML